MKIIKTSNVTIEDDFDENSEPSKSLSDLESLFPKFAKKAQEVYGEWDEDDVDTYAGGGICHLIAEEMVSIMWDNDIESVTYSSSHEQHVYTIAKVKEGIFAIDIHHSFYEIGGGFSWKKIPDVKFEPSFVSLYKITADLSEWSEIVEEF